jgi:murein DD-endopeptidase MepM/ murein hydrolase activator NlpD
MSRYAIVSALLLVALPAAAEPPHGLRLPLDCQPGVDCWILRHVDHDPGPGAQDYRCGELTGDGHQGVDFAIRDLAAMVEGVPVHAAATGVVEGLREGVPDINVEAAGTATVESRECGNGVRIDHGDGWVTMYCHMRRGSIMVQQGDRIEAGQQIGLVGLSGETSFPHLHFDLRQGERIVDPFVGLERTDQCGPGARPLWREDVMAQLVYQPVVLTSIGVAPGVPEREDVRRGYHREAGLSATSPALVIWVEAYWVEAGDRLRFQLIGPDLRSMFERTQDIERAHRSWFGFVGERRPGDAWPAGTYTAKVTLERGETARVALEKQVVVN